MWKRDEAVRPSERTTGGAAAGRRRPEQRTRPESSQKLERDIVNIGKSVVIKGELNGSEDLTIEGQVEGTIQLREHVLTIGPNGKIKAQVFAKAVIVLGEVHRQRHGLGEGRHPRQRLGRRRHHLAARGHRRRRALPRQRGHAAQGWRAGRARPRSQAGGTPARPHAASAAQAASLGDRSTRPVSAPVAAGTGGTSQAPSCSVAFVLTVLHSAYYVTFQRVFSCGTARSPRATSTRTRTCGHAERAGGGACLPDQGAAEVSRRRWRRSRRRR